MAKKSLIKFKDDTHFDNIRAHFISPEFSISEFEQQKFDRIKTLFSLRLKNKYSRQQAINRLLDDNPDISQATAYREYQMMAELYGEIEAVNRSAERLFDRENYYFLYQQLLKERNWEAAAKVYEKYTNTFPPENENEIDPDRIANHEYHLKIPASVVKIFKKKFGESPVLDFNATDAEFETLQE